MELLCNGTLPPRDLVCKLLVVPNLYKTTQLRSDETLWIERVLKLFLPHVFFFVLLSDGNIAAVGFEFVLQELPKGVVLYAERVVQDRGDVVLSARRRKRKRRKRKKLQKSQIQGRIRRRSGFFRRSLTVSRRGSCATRGPLSPGR